jgi:hypothetical protein
LAARLRVAISEASFVDFDSFFEKPSAFGLPPVRFNDRQNVMVHHFLITDDKSWSSSPTILIKDKFYFALAFVDPEL